MALEFSSNVSIKDADKDRFQLIHATQLYGTFFGIYAQIKCKKKDGKTFLDHMILTGINYKGPINLELCKDPDDPTSVLVDKEPRESGSGVVGIEFDIWVRASTKNVEKTFEKLTFDFSKYAQSQPRKFEIKDGNYLRALRKLQRMDAGGVGSKNEAIINGMFDSEYFVRDGELIRKRAQVSTGEVRQFTNNDFVKTQETVIGNPLNPGGGAAGASTINCTPSNLKVFS